MPVQFKALKVGQRYSFTDLGTGRVDTGVLKQKWGEGEEESLTISVEASRDRPREEISAPYSLYTIESLEPEPREAKREPIRDRKKEEREEREGRLKKIGSGRKRKTRKGKKSRKTLKKTQSRRRRRGGSSCSGI